MAPALTDTKGVNGQPSRLIQVSFSGGGQFLRYFDEHKAEMALLDQAQKLAVTRRLESLREATGLTDDERRVLSTYFWNNYFSCVRESVPTEVIMFIESRRLSAKAYSPGAQHIINAWLLGLEQKHYIKGNRPFDSTQYDLGRRGIEFFSYKRRPLLERLHRLSFNYLKLWQIVGVVVGIFVAIATLAGRYIGWW